MSRIYLVFIKIIIGIIFFFPLIARPSFLTTSNQDIVNHAVTDFMQQNKVAGVAIEAVMNGKAQGFYYGYANSENETPINEKTIFEIGSLSKLMTTLLLAEQIDYAKMSLADPVTKYISNLPAAFSNITLQNLATHTSGLPFEAPRYVNTQNELTDYLAKMTPTPNKQWLYSNLGIQLLAQAIVNQRHKPLDKLYHDNIGELINTLSITFVIPKHSQANAAIGYDKDGMPATASPLGLYPAAWAIKMSAIDMQRFLAAAVGISNTPSSILYPMKMTQVAYVQLPHRLQGLGWDLHTRNESRLTTLSPPSSQNKGPDPIIQIIQQPTFNNNLLIDKTGMTNGFRSYIAILPNREAGVVVLINKSVDLKLVEKLGRTILFNLSNANMAQSRVHIVSRGS